MTELTDAQRAAELARKLGLPEDAIPVPLALEALRHGSYCHERRANAQLGDPALRSNERLEFLGDAVLGLIVAERFWDLFPDFDEGLMTRMRAAVVNEEALAGLARGIGLGDLLLLGRGEERTGGRDKQSLLADAAEAVLAAVYLGCGWAVAQQVAGRLLEPLFAQARSGQLGRDYKTDLQELSQGQFRSSPAYRVVDAPGPQHARVFDVEVSLQGEALGRGTGRTKKEAEQAAARVALQALAARAARTAVAAAGPAAQPVAGGPAPPAAAVDAGASAGSPAAGTTAAAIADDPAAAGGSTGGDGGA